MKKWIVLAVVVAVVVGGVAMASLSPGKSVQVAKVRRGEIREFVDERAKTRLPETHLITMPFAGRIEPIKLIENQTVGKNDVVARIVESDLKDAADAAQAVVDRFQASIDEQNDVTVEAELVKQSLLFVRAMAETVAARQREKPLKQNLLDFAEKVLGRINQSSVAETEKERAQLQYENAKIEIGKLDYELRSTEAMHAATAMMPDIIRAYVKRKALGAAVLEKQLSEAQARLHEMRRQQRRGSIRSPVEGIVLERLVSNERYLSGGTILMRIGELDRLEIETDVLSQDAARIREGHPVEIYGPSIGVAVDKGVAGRVHRIHPAAFTKISSLGVEQQRVKVIIRFDAGVLSQILSTHNLGVDYRVRVRIFTRGKADAMIVPRSTLFRAADGNRWQVFTARDGRLHLTDVEIGLINDEEIEIVKGLSASEQVVIAPETSLADGMKIEATPRE
ncbi:MAG: efflux RND transporter periplasmic adaptor subunit [Planctomycetes bacterium]|nr:efflux RND transporter periplasmic adaptor subunit [Planctomycetota bacterium]